MSDPCCECLSCTCASLACCFSFAGSCAPLEACWCCKLGSAGQVEDEDEDGDGNGEFKPRAHESPFSGLNFWKWRTRKDDEEFAAQVVREAESLQRAPDAQQRANSWGERPSESGRQHGRSLSGSRAMLVDTQPPPSKGMEDGRKSSNGATSY
ncbi:hypothetical protein BDY19DRAFT_105370 [Irpex rosettiformis]|uniref:Uncharacterized protein n=1 Tax=Irpex rosettiformis TaxID=378272 RepID=A0ACB8U5S4_9APHY|nr:hypothetical protein BDY19DRAFT_105370 [Irpex rosettiformis]